MLAASEPYLHNGVYGSDQVAEVQATLNTKIGAGLAVDGNFGPLTELAVRQFQTQSGLAVDGIVGPNTWNLLMTSSQYTYKTNPNFQYETVMNPNQPVGVAVGPTGVQQYGSPIGPMPMVQDTPWLMWLGLAGVAYIMFGKKSCGKKPCLLFGKSRSRRRR